jgi:hypothetical protein
MRRSGVRVDGLPGLLLEAMMMTGRICISSEKQTQKHQRHWCENGSGRDGMEVVGLSDYGTRAR